MKLEDQRTYNLTSSECQERS